MISLGIIFINLLGYTIYVFNKIDQYNYFQQYWLFLVVTLGMISYFYRKNFISLYKTLIDKRDWKDKLGLILIYLSGFFIVAERSKSKDILNITIAYWIIYLIINRKKIKGWFNIWGGISSISLIVASLLHSLFLKKEYVKYYLGSIEKWWRILIFLPVQEFIKTKEDKENLIFLVLLGVLFSFFKCIPELKNAVFSEYRITGTYWNTMLFSYILIIVFFYGLSIIVLEKKYKYIPFVILSFVLLMLTKSRGAILLSFFVGIPLLFYHSKRVFIMVFLMLSVVFSFLPNKKVYISRAQSVIALTKSLENNNPDIRYLLWKSNLLSLKNSIESKIIIGSGTPNDDFLKNYDEVFKGYRTKDSIKGYAGDSHNIYLFLLTSFGLFGLPILSFLLVGIFCKVLETKNKKVKLMLIVLNLVCLLAGLTENLILKPSIYVYFFILGMILINLNIKGDINEKNQCDSNSL